MNLPSNAKRLSIGDWYFSDKKEDNSVILGLGSCIALILYDSEKHLGVMAHLMLPRRPNTEFKDALDLRYIEDAVPFLLDIMRLHDAKKIEAKVIGGATLFKELLAKDRDSIGMRNVKSVIKELEKQNIPISKSAIDREHGRTVIFNHYTGKIEIRSYKAGTEEI